MAHDARDETLFRGGDHDSLRAPGPRALLPTRDGIDAEYPASVTIKVYENAASVTSPDIPWGMPLLQERWLTGSGTHREHGTPASGAGAAPARPGNDDGADENPTGTATTRPTPSRAASAAPPATRPMPGDDRTATAPAAPEHAAIYGLPRPGGQTARTAEPAGTMVSRSPATSWPRPVHAEACPRPGPAAEPTTAALPARPTARPRWWTTGAAERQRARATEPPDAGGHSSNPNWPAATPRM